MANTNETATLNTPSGVVGDKYEAVIGLETHAQLQTGSKLLYATKFVLNAIGQ
jgi:hypothetical protein